MRFGQMSGRRVFPFRWFPTISQPEPWCIGGDVPGPEIALWALYPSRRLLSARVSAFLDCLKEAFPNGSPDELADYIGM
jgi:DNA-binding transcriptional LysR family regulator